MYVRRVCRSLSFSLQSFIPPSLTYWSSLELSLYRFMINDQDYTSSVYLGGPLLEECRQVYLKRNTENSRTWICTSHLQGAKDTYQIFFPPLIDNWFDYWVLGLDYQSLRQSDREWQRTGTDCQVVMTWCTYSERAFFFKKKLLIFFTNTQQKKLLLLNKNPIS